MLTRKEVADILGVSQRQVYRFEQRGCLPKVHLTKNIVRYLPKDLEKLIEDRRIEYNQGVFSKTFDGVKEKKALVDALETPFTDL